MSTPWWPASREAYEWANVPVPGILDCHCDVDCCGDQETCHCDCGFCDCRYAERMGS